MVDYHRDLARATSAIQYGGLLPLFHQINLLKTSDKNNPKMARNGTNPSTDKKLIYVRARCWSSRTCRKLWTSDHGNLLMQSNLTLELCRTRLGENFNRLKRWSAVWCILTQLQGSFWVYFCSRPKRRIKTWFRTCGCVRYVRYTQYMNNNFNQNNKHKNTRRSEGLNHESSNSILFSLDSKWLPPKP